MDLILVDGMVSVLSSHDVPVLLHGVVVIIMQLRIIKGNVSQFVYKVFAILYTMSSRSSK